MESDNNLCLSEDTEPSIQGISKNKLKKQLKYIKAKEKKKERRSCEREKHRQKYKTDRQNGGKCKEEVRKNQLERLELAKVGGIRVCVDLQFETLMDEKELNHLANQLKRVYSANKSSPCPFSLHLVNYDPAGRTMRKCCEKNTGFLSYCLSFDQRSVTDVFVGSDIVYLSPDAPEILESLEIEKVYVIGGLVDDSVKSRVSLEAARESGVSCARLPIAEHMVRRSEGKGSFKQILTINQIFEILLKFHETGDWPTALSVGVPPKTGFVLPGNT